MDFLAGILELIGSYLVGEKRKITFIFSFFGNLLWILYTLIYGHTYGLLIICVPAIILNVVNYIKWSKSYKNV